MAPQSLVDPALAVLRCPEVYAGRPGLARLVPGCVPTRAKMAGTDGRSGPSCPRVYRPCRMTVRVCPSDFRWGTQRELYQGMEKEAKDAVCVATADRRIRAGVIDLLAFGAVLLFVGTLALIHMPLTYAGIMGLAVSCTTVWGRLRRPGLRRWQSGQVIYRRKNFSIVSAWGTEGQAPFIINQASAAEPLAGTVAGDAKQQPVMKTVYRG